MIVHHGRTTGFAFVALVATTLLAVYTANAYPTPRNLQDVAARPSDNAVAQPESTVLLKVVAAREPSMDLNLLSHDTIKARNPCMNCECEEDCPAMCCPQKTAAAAERSISDNIVADTLALTMATPPLELRGQNCIECGEGEDKPQAGPPNCCPQNHTHGRALILDNYQATTLLAEASHQNAKLTLMARDADAKDVEQQQHRKTSEELALLSDTKPMDNVDAYCGACICPHCPAVCMSCGSVTATEGRAVDDVNFPAPRLLDDTLERAHLSTSTELAARGAEAVKTMNLRGYCDECDCAVDCPQECCEDQTTLTARIAGKVVINTVENLERHLVSTELANRGEQATEEIKARQNCEGCLRLDSSLACPGWCPPACCPGQATTERRIAGKVAEDAAKRDLQGHALLATELAIPGDDQEKTAEISARACIHCSCDAGDCPEYCCEPQTTITSRFAGEVVAHGLEDLEGNPILSIELAIPGGQEKSARPGDRDLRARFNCDCTCGVDCPQECCDGQVVSRADIANEAIPLGAAGVKKSLASPNTLTTTELAAREVEFVEGRINPCSLCYCHNDCPAECCSEETSVTERIAGDVTAHAKADSKSPVLISGELAIPGDEEKTAELKVRDICLGCTCDADCPQICCGGQTITAARVDDVAAHSVKRAVAGVEDGHHLTRTELAAPRDEESAAEMKVRDYCLGCTCDGDCPESCCQGQTLVDQRIAATARAVEEAREHRSVASNELAISMDQEKGAELHASDLWKRYCENCHCDVDCPLECCGSEKLVTERLAGEIANNGANGDLEGRNSLPSTELTVRDGQVAETIKKSNYCDECSCDVDCPAECCPPEQTIVVGRLAGEVEAPHIIERGDYDVNDGLAVSTAFAVRGEETMDLRACGGCSCGHTNCPTWCCGEETAATARLAEVAGTVEGEVRGPEERHDLPVSTELIARGQETVKPDSCGGCDCDEGDCPVVCCGEQTTVTARISEPAADPRASAELTVRGTGLVKPDNCPTCVCGEADCPTECCGTQEMVAERIAAQSADLEDRALVETTGVAVRGEKKAVEIKGGVVPDNCPSCVCGEADCPTECCGKQEAVMGRLAGEVGVAHEAAEEPLEDGHHHDLASISTELVARGVETVQTRDCTNCICDEQECPAVCCPAKVSTTADGDVDVVKVLSSVEGRGEEEG